MKGLIKKSNLYIVVVIVITVFVVLFFGYLNFKSKLSIEKQLETFSLNEGKTISEMMFIVSKHLVETDEKNLISFLKTLLKNEAVVFVAVKKDNELIFADTKYEGFLPIELEYENGVSFFNSPVGKILTIHSEVVGKNKFDVFIGYDLSIVDMLKSKSSKRFIFVAGLQIVVFFIFVGTLFLVNRQMAKHKIELIKEKEEKERFKELLLLSSGITHEIKNPLNSIYLAFQLIEPHINREKENVSTYVQALKREIKRINEIVTSYSKLVKELYVKKSYFEFVELKEELEFYLDSLGLKYEIHSNIPDNFMLYSSKDLLKQVLLNLIKNAYEASAKEIKIYFEKVKKQLFIRVIDNGEGILDKDKEKIFNPFYSKKSEGMGIGLALSKKMISAIGGKIFLESSEKGRTIFVIILELMEGK